ncbi:MAG: sialate O-acetylesterase [Opitutales bacterium]
MLQGGVELPVWGWAEPGAQVALAFAGQRQTAPVGADGRWTMRLRPLEASSDPKEMRIESSTGSSLVIEDLLIGEVWLCAGQSNVAVGLNEVDASAEAIAAARFPHIRMFRLPESPAERLREDAAGRWLACEPGTAAAFSAIAYYFARRLQAELDVPVGLVVSAWGGSSVAAWMSPDARSSLGANLPEDVIGWRVNTRPSRLFNAMLAPLVPYAMRGVVWYQGESDAEPFANPYLYRHSLRAMIEDWRRRWGKPDWPFYFFQLPNLDYPDESWAVLRESQAAVAALPHTEMVTTIDLGQAGNLHPTNKRDFSERLAALVLAREYGYGELVRSPRYLSHRLESRTGCVRLDFSDLVGHLQTLDGAAPRAFRIAGADRIFHPAAAVLDGESVLLSSPQVADPVAVRYAWAPNPEVNLVGPTGLPLTPFRTDDWPVRGQTHVWQTLPLKAVLGEQLEASAVASGDPAGWQWAGRPETLPPAASADLVRLLQPGLLQLLVAPHWLEAPRRGEEPVLRWTLPLVPESPLEKGLSFEMEAQLFRATHPFCGLDVELGLRRADGAFCRYRFSIQPLRVHGFRGEEIHLLAADLGNAAGLHRYRIAVRPDGFAQLYFDGAPIGGLAGEPIDAPADQGAYLSWGKLAPRGQMTANLSTLAYDLSGAYAPLAGGPSR